MSECSKNYMTMNTQTKILFKPLNIAEVNFYIFSLSFTGLAVFIPYILHQLHIAGPQFLPMHYFVVLAGFLFGWRSGLVVGIFSPLISYSLTHLPAAAILPEVVLELAVYGLIIGFLSQKKVNNIFFKGVSSRRRTAGQPKESAPLETSLFCSSPQSGGVYKIINILPALLISMLAGRLARFLFVFLFGLGTNPLAYFKMSLPGIILQIVLIPFLISVLAKTISKVSDDRTI